MPTNNPRKRFTSAIGLLAVLLPAGGLAAQSLCKPAASTSEARLLAFFASPLAFAVAPEVGTLERWQVSIVGELTAVPTAPAAINRSTGACGFNKSENSALSPVFPRPRLALGLGAGFAVEASWLPPVTVADATPHIGAAALSWSPTGLTLPFGSSLTIRAHATVGGVDGPVTCPRNELQLLNVNEPCYGSEPSDDTYEPNVRGLEAVVVRREGKLHWYAGLGANAVAARFVVNFTDDRGFLDNNTVEISLMRAVILGGAVWNVRETLALTGQLYSVQNDATTGRLGIAWRLR